MSFGIPVRNGLGVGLLSYATSLARRGGAAVVPPLAGFQYGYNMPGPNDYVPGGVIVDWGKVTFAISNLYYIPPVKGTYDIQTNTGVTLSNFSAGITVNSSNPTTGLHNITISDYPVNNSNVRSVNWSGTAPTRFTVTKPGYSNKISSEFISGTQGKWLRNLDMDYTNIVPLVGAVSPPRPAPTDYFYPRTSVGSCVPYQDLADGIYALKAANPSFVGLWDVLGVDLTDTDITNRATYQRNNIQSNVLIALEFGNELFWNINFEGVARQMIDGVRNGYYGAATESAPQPTKTVAFGVNGYIDSSNFSSPAMTTGQYVGVQNYGGIGTSIWRALRTVSAGSKIIEGADFTMEFSYNDCITAGKRWAAVRHNQILNIYESVFGAARFASQIVPVIMGQDGGNLSNDTLIQRTFVTGYFAKVRGMGVAHYTDDYIATGFGYATTANGIDAAFRANLPATISRMTTNVAVASGFSKVYMSYEGMTHPTNFPAYQGNTNGYKTAWDSLFSSAAGQTLMSDIAYAMKQVLTGPTCGYMGIGIKPWALYENWGDTSNKRLVGWTNGINPLYLGPLTMSGVLRIGTATSGTITGSLAGSTITSNIPGITVNNSVFPPTYTGTPTGSAGTISNGLVETLAGSPNTPRDTSITTLPVLPKFVYIKTTGTFTVPADVPASCTVHCIGAGGRGWAATGGALAHGGGGGAYARASVSLTPSAVINVQVGAEGSQTDTWLFNSSTVLAKAGSNATSSVTGAGGTAAASIGSTKYDGGTGGISPQTFYPHGGGGGSAGPSGTGKNGGSPNNAGGGGGGGSNGGSSTAGLAGTYSGTSIGGFGGYGNDGVSRGTGGQTSPATAGTNGGGGGGGGDPSINGANGGMQNYWVQTSNSENAGPSGGGGGAEYGGIGGGVTGYGGGSGGTGGSTTPTAAAPGLIVLEYTP